MAERRQLPPQIRRVELALKLTEVVDSLGS